MSPGVTINAAIGRIKRESYPLGFYLVDEYRTPSSSVYLIFRLVAQTPREIKIRVSTNEGLLDKVDYSVTPAGGTVDGAIWFLKRVADKYTDGTTYRVLEGAEKWKLWHYWSSKAAEKRRQGLSDRDAVDREMEAFREASKFCKKNEVPMEWMTD